MLIPHRLALALQADGWTVRNDCVFAKVAPMPESIQGTRWTRCRVKVAPGRPATNQEHLPDDGKRPGGNRGNQWGDVQNQPNAKWQDCPGCPRCEAHGGYVLGRGSWRHTRAHETVLHLSKGMNYWSDQESVREAHISNADRPCLHQGLEPPPGDSVGGMGKMSGRYKYGSVQNPAGRNPRSVLSHDDPMRDLFRFIPREAWNEFLRHWADEFNRDSENPISVLTPKPESYSGKHYAVFSTSLIRPLIKSSCPTKCCPACGSGWAPRVEKERSFESGSGKAGNRPNGKYKDWEGTGLIGNDLRMGPTVSTTILDYLPTCACARKLVEEQISDGPQTGAEWVCRLAETAEQLAPVPGIVLDPFFGSGTTGIVARELGVDCIGLDLSYAYLKDQARARLGFDAWDAWHQGRDGDVVGDDLEGLPLFEGVET